MEVRLLEQDKDNHLVSFIVKESSPGFANVIRRTVLGEVPSMAIEDVEIRKNSSILYDELVASRLGLVPLTTDLKSYVLPDECKCEGKGCNRCQLTLTLKEKGPCTVLSSSIKTKDSAVKPVFGELPITKLLKGQSIEVEVKAQLGRGKDHAKWSPAHIFYKQKADVSIDNNNIQDKEKCVEIVPNNVLELQNGQLVVAKDRLLDADLCDVAADLYPKAITVTKSNDFIFTMESWGQLDCKAILLEASSILNKKLDLVLSELKNASS